MWLTQCKKLVSVLIETYWNVNYNPMHFKSVGTSINRNILECKCFSELFQLHRELVLIETYWNVNRAGRILYVTPDVVLIETYWNVN